MGLGCFVSEDQMTDTPICECGDCGGIQVARGELWNRVAYHAEEAGFLFGERYTEPHILDYGDDIATPEEWAGEVRGGRKPLAAIAAKEQPHG